MSNILGIDLGTNSIGWALINEDEQFIVDSGVSVFPEGIHLEKGVEQSKNKERGEKRQSRRMKSRRRFRKNMMLKLLIYLELFPESNLLKNDPWIKNQLEQFLNNEELPKKYRNKLKILEKADDLTRSAHFVLFLLRIATTHSQFLNDETKTLWNNIKEFLALNPYELRDKALNEPLSKTEFARVLYQLSMRRGFKSNRKKPSSEKEDNRSEVKSSISTLQKDINESTSDTLGQYLFHQNPHEEKCRWRERYTSRAMYIEEFQQIWDKQTSEGEGYHAHLNTIPYGSKNLPLRDYIGHPNFGILFYQRPLRSQKHLVSKCKFEPKKRCCHISNPKFEEFRALQQINSIRIKSKDSSRELSKDERLILLEMFNTDNSLTLKKIKDALSLAKTEKLNFGEDEDEKNVNNNAKIFTANHTNIQLNKLFGQKWNQFNDEQKKEIWSYIISFDDNEKLFQLLNTKYGLDESQKDYLPEIQLKDGYSELSLKAIKKILPYLKKGLIYSHAVFLANIDEVMKDVELETDAGIDLNTVIIGIIAIISEHNEEQKRKKKFEKIDTLVSKIKEYLREDYEVPEQNLKHLWHPSIIEDQPTNQEKLPKPNFDAIKNPVVIKALYELRATVNAIIDKYGKPDTIRVELSRELNDKSKRIAWRKWQNRNEKEKNKAIQEIKKVVDENFKISDTDIKKYRLYEELKTNGTAQCPYTGKTINVGDLFGENPEFDIEHIIPRSRILNNSMSNLTLCCSDFNRNIKINKTPLELKEIPGFDYDAMISRITFYKEKEQKLKKELDKAKTIARMAAPGDAKTDASVKKHLLAFEYQYYRSKYKKFIQEYAVDPEEESFANNQLTDTGYISKFATKYLKTVFEDVHPVKGKITSMLREEWGLPKKDRSSHLHHAEDAIIIALTKRSTYQRLATHVKKIDNRTAKSLKMSPPWSSFKNDVHNSVNNILVFHKKQNAIISKYKRTIFNKGKKYKVTINSVRGKLHEETNQGLVYTDHKKQNYNYAVKKSVDDLTNSNLKNLPKTIYNGSEINSIDEIQNLIPIKKVTFIKDGTSFRKKLGLLQFEHIPLLTEPAKTIITNRLTSLNVAYENKTGQIPSFVFDEPLFMPIKKMRLHESPTTRQQIRPGVFVKLGNTHHAAIYIDNDGKLSNERVSFFDAVQRKINKEPVIASTTSDGRKLVSYFIKNELFLLNLTNDEIKNAIENEDYRLLNNHLYRVQKIDYSALSITFRKHSAANLENDLDKENFQSTSKWQKLNPVKIIINRLGNIISIEYNNV